MTFELVQQRRAGVLAHLTSLPGPHGHGDLGPSALHFASFLQSAGQSVWQMLPVSPPGWGESPYDSPSTFAGSPWLVSLELLRNDGLLSKAELRPTRALQGGPKALQESQAFREARLRLAHGRFQQSGNTQRKALRQFRAREANWLADHCLFSALKQKNSGSHWCHWSPGLRKRNPAALQQAREELAQEVAFHEWVQFVFDAQWRALATHCKSHGIALLGDLPMFVAHDGADAWAHQALFRLNANGEKLVVAGVPPDAFSRTGQLWGNPVYDWKALKRTGFAWWIARLGRTLALFDVSRLDHFIGFHRCFEIPADAKDARHGSFVRAPGDALFAHARKALGSLPFLAEDLGLVTQEVIALRESFGLPGMRVLQFAFSDPAGSDYLPHRYTPDTVVYTGTHDNNTTQGWYRELGQRGSEGRAERKRLHAYLGNSREELHDQLIRLAYASVAALAIVPLQDMLGLGAEARMNVPGTSTGNWAWRCRTRDLSPRLAKHLRTLSISYERCR